MAMKGPQDMMAAIHDTMKERTGRTLEEWIKVVHASGIDPLDRGAVRRWLKSEHGVLQNSRWAISFAAAQAAGWTAPSVEEYIDSQYTGTKEALRPIFDRLREFIDDLGDDITTEGRGTYTPFVRRRQFLAIAAATKARVDVGLRYTDPPKSKLLSEAKAPGQATHKMSLTAVDDITSEVERLIRIAYEQNG